MNTLKINKLKLPILDGNIIEKENEILYKVKTRCNKYELDKLIDYNSSKKEFTMVYGELPMDCSISLLVYDNTEDADFIVYILLSRKI